VYGQNLYNFGTTVRQYRVKKLARQQKGSPKKLPAELKNKLLKLVVDAREEKMIKKAAQRASLSVSAWLRQVALKAAKEEQE
jgi:hypothetical protein